MPKRKTVTAVEALRATFGDRPFSVADGIKAGTPRTTLHRLIASGQLQSPSRGVLQIPGGGTGMLSELALVSARAPGATVCLNSALSFWDLTDEIPRAVHIAVPRGSWRPSISAPTTKVHVFNAETFGIERTQVKTDVGEPFWVYSPERSVVDAIRMARWVGRDVGLHALRRYMDGPGAKPGSLLEISRQIGGTRALSPALEAILS